MKSGRRKTCKNGNQNMCKKQSIIPGHRRRFERIRKPWGRYVQAVREKFAFQQKSLGGHLRASLRTWQQLEAGTCESPHVTQRLHEAFLDPTTWDKSTQCLLP